MGKQQQAAMPENTVEVYNERGSHQIVLVCEHASTYMPAMYAQLGLSDDVARSHIAWDPGAQDTARYLADTLDAVLVAGTVSRLIYDLNRPPESAGAMIEHSEKYPVPGNQALTAAERQTRIDNYYRPFVSEVANVLQQRTGAVLVTVHSFTPVYNGVTRTVEIGVLHDTDARLADAMLADTSPVSAYNVQRNEPYGAQDGVTHTLKLHALPAGIPNVMLEVRNDLIADAAACETMAALIGQWLTRALARLPAESPAQVQS